MSDLVYLATPYSHPDEHVRIQRYDAARWYAYQCHAAGELILSPIVHSHPLTAFGAGGDFRTWQRLDTALLRGCQSMRILELPGWRDSKGIDAERKFAQELFMPIRRVNDPMATRIANGEFHYLDAAGVWSLDMIKLRAAEGDE